MYASLSVSFFFSKLFNHVIKCEHQRNTILILLKMCTCGVFLRALTIDNKRLIKIHVTSQNKLFAMFNFGRKTQISKNTLRLMITITSPRLRKRKGDFHNNAVNCCHNYSGILFTEYLCVRSELYAASLSMTIKKHRN